TLLPNITLSATRRSDNLTFWANTDINGNYIFSVDSGTYDIQIQSPYIYHQSNCAINSPISFAGFYQQDTTDIPLLAMISCPMLYVDVSTPLLRRCFPNTYTVSY